MISACCLAFLPAAAVLGWSIAVSGVTASPHDAIPTGRLASAVSLDLGGETRVAVFDTSGELVTQFAPIPNFTEGFSLAIGDVAGDESLDLVMGFANGFPGLQIMDGDVFENLPSTDTTPPATGGGVVFPPAPHGINLALADIDGNGELDIIAAASNGGPPEVRVFTDAQVAANDFSQPAFSFAAFDATFTGGVWLATGDYDGDGLADVVAAIGVGAPPIVRIFRNAGGGQPFNGEPLDFFSAFGRGFRGGVNVATGDLDGDGRAEIVAGQSSGGGEVRVFRGAVVGDDSRRPPGVAFALDPFGTAFQGGVRVAVGDYDGDEVPELGMGMADAGTDVSALNGPLLLAGEERQERSFTAFPGLNEGVLLGFPEGGEWDPEPLAEGIAVVGTTGGVPGQVRVFDSDGSPLRALGGLTDLRGGVTVAVGDVTGDGVADVVTGAGPGGGPHVRVFDGLGIAAGGRSALQPTWEFLAFPGAFRGGVQVAVGDLDGDGTSEIVAAAGPGLRNSPVRIFNSQQLFLNDFGRPADFVRGLTGFSGGVTVAVADVDGDGLGDVITGALADGRPRVQVFSGSDGPRGVVEEAPLAGFFAFDPSFRGGVSVAGGDVNGDRRADILVAAGPLGSPGVPPGGEEAIGPTVRVFDGNTLTRRGGPAILQELAGHRAGFLRGFRIAAGNRDGDNNLDVIVSPRDPQSGLRLFEAASNALKFQRALPVRGIRGKPADGYNVALWSPG